jgi:hypothetical protein
MRFGFMAAGAFLLIARGASAQLVASPQANPLGTWRGSSRCVIRNSSCSDEIIVYRVSQESRRDSLFIDARNVVDGREGAANVLRCQLNAARAYITCSVPNGKWRMTVRRDSLVGQFRLRDGTWVRDVHAVRSVSRE